MKIIPQQQADEPGIGYHSPYFLDSDMGWNIDFQYMDISDRTQECRVKLQENTEKCGLFQYKVNTR